MRNLLPLAFLALLLSGCAGGARPAASGDPNQAPMAQAGTEHGAITGVVFDPELAPLAGIEVLLVKDGFKTTSDASGAFTFNGLEPGNYELRFQGAGFETVGRRTDVVAGEVTGLRIELRPDLSAQAYHWSFSRVGLVRAGQWTLQYAQHYANNSALDAILCDPCAYPVSLQPQIVDAVTDVQYIRGASVPLVNEYVTVAYSVPQTTEGTLKLLMTHDFTPRHTYQWNTVQVRELRGFERVRLEFHGPDIDKPGILVNQKVELWQTFAHGQPLPKGYSLLPG